MSGLDSDKLQLWWWVLICTCLTLMFVSLVLGGFAYSAFTQKEITLREMIKHPQEGKK